ncbi:MAG: glycoside hydrolase family 2 protein [Lachnospiraceae bacterium]|nr:glycoside hydrolase family 2 protein [Lachnospiraceae bacterium]
MKIALNRGWDFYFDKNSEEKCVVDIPHTVKETPFDSFSEELYQTVCKYVKKIPLTEDMKDKALVLHFAGVAHRAEVFVNGKLRGVHTCGYTAFDVDITKAAFENMKQAGEIDNETALAVDKDSTSGKKAEDKADTAADSANQENADNTDAAKESADGKKIIGEAVIEVIVDTNENLNQPPFGNIIDYMTYGGIYREVHLEVRNKLHIKDAYYIYNQMDIYGGMLHTKLMLSSETKEKLFFDIKLADPNGFVVAQGHGQIGVSKALPEKRGFSFADIPGSSSEKDDLVPGIADLALGGLDTKGLGIGKAKDVELGDKLINDLEGVSHNFDLMLSDVVLWRPENPMLYTVTLRLLQANPESEDKNDLIPIDECSTKVGLRCLDWRTDGFYLNGKKYKLRGLNRHQSYAYVGYAMPDRVQKEDARILKEELGVNCVRTSHYPQAQSFYEACDELGLFVITEIPGWQHIGDDEWKRIAVVNTREMVSQYRNHPSVILWGTRINESQDDDDFYKSTNETAKELAPLDFTGGIRNFAKSNLIEDVYTYNDFIHNGTEKGACAKKDITYDMKKAYMVTEHNGHMYPAKPFDSEDKRVEQAMRHAKVVNDVWAQEDIAGCTGWCMFDYNTHKQFGSGDHICYHGVMDMFRNPKYAAAFYKSQTDNEPIMEVAASLDLGDYPASVMEKICIFTNLDSVKFYKDDTLVGEFFPDKTVYGSLPHPPVIIDDFAGDLLVKQEKYPKEKADKIKEAFEAIRQYGRDNLPIKTKLALTKLNSIDKISMEKINELYVKYVIGWGWGVKKYEFVGYKNGAEVMRVERKPSEKAELEIKTGDTELVHGDCYDASSIRMMLKDENGKVMSFTMEPVMLEAEGSIEIMGPKVALLRGGMGGTYVKTKGIGDGKLTIKFRDTEKVIEYKVSGK